MKQSLIIYISAFCLILVNSYDLKITSILTDKVASDGMLILDTTGMKYAVKSLDFHYSHFTLTIKNEKTSVEVPLQCFIYQFSYIVQEEAKLCCRTKGLEEGMYSINPITEKTVYYHTSITMNILPSVIKGIFQVQSGKDIYFYDLMGNTHLEFYIDYDCDKIEFSLFDSYPEIESTKVYFDDIAIDCFYHTYKLECPIKAEQFTQTQYKRYTLSLKNGKNNYFVHPFSLSLYYIKE